jgi:hypothetical protein
MVCSCVSTLVHSLLCVANCPETKENLGKEENGNLGGLEPVREVIVTQTHLFFLGERFDILDSALESRF